MDWTGDTWPGLLNSCELAALDNIKPALSWAHDYTILSCGTSWLKIDHRGETLLRLAGQGQLQDFAKALGLVIAAARGDESAQALMPVSLPAFGNSASISPDTSGIEGVFIDIGGVRWRLYLAQLVELSGWFALLFGWRDINSAGDESSTIHIRAHDTDALICYESLKKSRRAAVTISPQAARRLQAALLQVAAETIGSPGEIDLGEGRAAGVYNSCEHNWARLALSHNGAQWWGVSVGKHTLVRLAIQLAACSSAAPLAPEK